MTRKTKNYKKTQRACYLGFVTQAICANFLPLLYITFYNVYDISFGKLAFVSTGFFITQLVVDFLCADILGKIKRWAPLMAQEIYDNYKMS